MSEIIPKDFMSEVIAETDVFSSNMETDIHIVILRHFPCCGNITWGYHEDTANVHFVAYETSKEGEEYNTIDRVEIGLEFEQHGKRRLLSIWSHQDKEFRLRD